MLSADVQGQGEHVEPEGGELAVARDQGVAVEAVDEPDRGGGEQDPQRRRGAREVVAAERAGELGRHQRAAHGDARADVDHHVAGRAQRDRHARVGARDVAREQREHRHEEGGGQGRGELADPPRQRVQAELLERARERDDQRVGAEVRLVERERGAERERGDDEPAHRRPVGARAGREQRPHQQRGQRQRHRGAHAHGAHDGVEAEVERHHDHHGGERGGAARDVGDRDPARAQVGLQDRDEGRVQQPEHERHARDQDGDPHVGRVGHQQRGERGGRGGGDREARAQRERRAEHRGRALRLLGQLADDDRGQAGVGEHAEELHEREREREAAVEVRAEVAGRDRDRDEPEQQHRPAPGEAVEGARRDAADVRGRLAAGHCAQPVGTAAARRATITRSSPSERVSGARPTAGGAQARERAAEPARALAEAARPVADGERPPQADVDDRVEPRLAQQPLERVPGQQEGVRGQVAPPARAGQPRGLRGRGRA